MPVVATIILAFIAIFLTTLVSVAAAWMLLQQRICPHADASVAASLLKEDVLSTISPWASFLARFNFIARMKASIAEADVSWSVGRVTLLMLLSGTVALVILLNLSWLPRFVVLAVSGLAAAGPFLYILHKRKSRLARFAEQFPDALDFLSSALRAGHPLPASLEMLAAESPPPLSIEIKKTFEEGNLGRSLDQVLENLTRRVPLVDVSCFAAAVALHSRTGGKLSEVLGKLAETVRDRLSLQGEIRAIAAHGRLTGLMLTLLPLAVLLIMWMVSPSYVRILLEHPRGPALMLAAGGCLIAAHLVIRKIADIQL